MGEIALVVCQGAHELLMIGGHGKPAQKLYQFLSSGLLRSGIDLQHGS
jgi:hypothetical protein